MFFDRMRTHTIMPGTPEHAEIIAELVRRGFPLVNCLRDVLADHVKSQQEPNLSDSCTKGWISAEQNN